MKRKWINIIIVIVFLLQLGCGIGYFCELSPTIGVDSSSNEFVISEDTQEDTNKIFSVNSQSQTLNSILRVAPHLTNTLSLDTNFQSFRNLFNTFSNNHSKLIKKAYRQATCSDILYSYTLGYALSKEILNDSELFDQETRARLEEYSGFTFEEYALIHGFWVAYHYLRRKSVEDHITNTKLSLADRLEISFRGDGIGVRFRGMGFLLLQSNSL